MNKARISSAEAIAESQLPDVTLADGTIGKVKSGVWSPYVDKNGKPVKVAGADTTDEAKNAQALINLGMEPEKAWDTVLNRKGMSDDEMRLSLTNNLTTAATRGNIGGLSEDELTELNEEIQGIVESTMQNWRVRSGGGAPGAPSSTTAAPAAVTIPTTMTDEQLKTFVADALSRGADKAVLTKAVRDAGRDPAKVGLGQ
jgi:hypothetical protein